MKMHIQELLQNFVHKASIYCTFKLTVCEQECLEEM